MKNSMKNYLNEHVVSKIKGIKVGSTIENMESGLEYIVSQYRTNHDREVRVSARSKMTEMLDYIFLHNLSDKIELTKYMLYD